MAFEILISTAEAFAHLGDPAWLFIDARYTLGDGGKGYRDYTAGHLPGAIVAGLDDDLASRPIPGKTGRHPLPAPEIWAATLSRWGITPETQVVAYDDGVGQSAAGRLWWMLKWAGHDAVAVLDGGMPRWVAAGHPLSTAAPSHRQGVMFVAHWRNDLQASVDEVAAAAASGAAAVLDSRAPERYRGEVEPIDPVAGHIPGALSVPYATNITSDGLMASTETLKARFQGLAPGRPATEVIFYCGSGVSATQNLLAFALTGRGIPRLFVGSWSEWVTDPKRGVERG